MKNWQKILIIVACFFLYYLGSRYFRVIMYAINEYVNQGLLSYFITYVLIGVPIFIGTYLVNKQTNVFTSLGLNGNFFKGFMTALLFASPMLIGGLVLYEMQVEGDVQNLIAKTLFAGFFEELYFRAFLFGLVFRLTKVGFIPAILLGAVVFATGHLYQSPDAGIQLGVFLATFLGAGYFAWLYVEWEYNLWLPIILHTLMNFSWAIFDMSHHAAGDMSANMLRVMTIALSIIVTILYKRKQGKLMTISKTTVWMK